MCSQMDHWFHFSEGNLLLRGAAAATGTSVFSGRLPGISRKVVALAEEPGHLLQNFPAYATALQGRVAYQRLPNHAGPPLTMLHAGGRRLTSADLIAFTMLFLDSVKVIVAPWALLVQSCSLEPWAMGHRQRLHEKKTAQAAVAARTLREFLRIVVLLRQHVPNEELSNFVRAWFYGSPRKMFVTHGHQPHGYQPQKPSTRRHFRHLSAGIADDRDKFWDTAADADALVSLPCFHDELERHLACRSPAVPRATFVRDAAPWG